MSDADYMYADRDKAGWPLADGDVGNILFQTAKALTAGSRLLP